MRKKYVFLNNYLLRCLNVGKNILKQETRSLYLRIILFKCCEKRNLFHEQRVYFRLERKLLIFCNGMIYNFPSILQS